MTPTEKLKAALRWALEGNRAVDLGRGWEFRDSGCGCCSGEAKPPEDLRATIVEALNSAQGKPGEPR
jgi:hypothetical protein